jgi:hypothetical protein
MVVLGALGGTEALGGSLSVVLYTGAGIDLLVADENPVEAPEVTVPDRSEAP